MPFQVRITLLAVTVLLGAAPLHAQYGPARVQSISTAGVAVGNGSSFNCALSDDGRYLVFESTATNLTSAASSGVRQIFVHDRSYHATALISSSSAPDNFPGDADSTRASISADGRYVAFQSKANYLTLDTSIGESNVFRRDRTSGETLLMSASYNAEHTSFDSTYPAVSPDGRFVAFLSVATNIVAAPADSAYYSDVFLAKPGVGATEAISLTSGGAFPSAPSDAGWPALSGDGRYVVFGSASASMVAGDTNGFADVFIRDREGGTAELVSIAPDGSQFGADARALGPGSLSADGNLVLFAVEQAPEQIYLRDRGAGATELVSKNAAALPGDGASSSARMSADGRYVVFKSAAANLLAEAPKGGLFLLDRQEHRLTLIDAKGSAPCVSNDASVVAYDKFDSASGVNQIFTREIDGCPEDDNKESPGACGCGTADTDTDLDGTPDCVDLCPRDPDKVASGICGCDVADSDQNGNGTIDCKENWFRPGTPRVLIKGKTAQIRMQRLGGARYEMTLTFKKKRRVRNYRSARVMLRNLAAGSYSVKYRIIDLSSGTAVRGLESRARSFKIR